MRCPKCHYLSFDPEPRCKNCGYGMVLDDAAEELGPLDRAEPAAQSPPADDALMDLVLRIRPDTVEDDPEVSMGRSEPPPDLPMRELTSEPRPASAPRGPFDLPEAILVPPPVRTGREQRPAASVRTPAAPTPARHGTPAPDTRFSSSGDDLLSQGIRILGWHRRGGISGGHDQCHLAGGGSRA